MLGRKLVHLNILFLEIQGIWDASFYSMTSFECSEMRILPLSSNKGHVFEGYNTTVNPKIWEQNPGNLIVNTRCTRKDRHGGAWWCRVEYGGVGWGRPHSRRSPISSPDRSRRRWRTTACRRSAHRLCTGGTLGPGRGMGTRRTLRWRCPRSPPELQRAAGKTTCP